MVLSSDMKEEQPLYIKENKSLEHVPSNWKYIQGKAQESFKDF